MDAREAVVVDASAKIEATSVVVDFGIDYLYTLFLLVGLTRRISVGKTNMNITLARIADCTSGGPLDVCTLCKAINCDANLHLGDGWVENKPKFTAVAFTANGKTAVGPTIPGEALLELGNEVCLAEVLWKTFRCC